MNTTTSCVLMLALLGVTALSCQASQGFAPPGPNVALGKSYTLEPDTKDAPYGLTLDDGDAVQLTDGIFAPETGAIWFHKECVGWYYPRPHAAITIDLEEDAPIAGVAMSSQAGGAGVTWPPVVLIAVSQDGEQFQLVGELLYLSARHGVPPAARHVLVTDDLRCHGRYVRLVIPSARYIFTDEIEVYRGPDELLEQPIEGEPLDDVDAYLSTNQVPLAIRNWVARDLFRAREELAASSAPDAVRDRVAAALDRVEADNRRLVGPPGEDYRTVFPLTSAHGRLFRALGDLRGAEGRPRLQAWKNNRWERLSLWDDPSAGQTARDLTVQVRMIQGERRADTVNIANNSRRPVSARAWLEGLPGGAAPDYVSVREAEYVALAAGRWEADALPEAALEGGQWQITLPAGVSRQLWFAFHPGADVTPGNYSGTVVIEAEDGERLRVPLQLTLEPLQYPEEHTLSFGMWDYAYPGGEAYGLTAGNLSAAVGHMRSYGYNVPWSYLFPWVTAENFDDEDNLVQSPDMSRFDEWVSMWPDARYYAVFFGSWTVSADSYAGVEIGSEKFSRRVGAVMRFWADHVRDLGIDPQRILLLTVDEPRAEYRRGAERSLLWARTIKTAVPEFTLFVDPTDRQPQTTGLREMYEAHDILCPHISHYFSGGQETWDFYEELRAGGRELWLYNTSGGPSSLQAIANHRGQQWKLWLIKGTGTQFWSYADVGGSPGGSWNQFAATGEIYSKVYIDATSITDGKHWLAIIEGIQDYEYLRMLRDRVDELEAAGSQGPALDRAREILDTLPAQAIEAADDGDIEAYDRGRLTVLDALLALY